MFRVAPLNPTAESHYYPAPHACKGAIHIIRQASTHGAEHIYTASQRYVCLAMFISLDPSFTLSCTVNYAHKGWDNSWVNTIGVA